MKQKSRINWNISMKDMKNGIQCTIYMMKKYLFKFGSFAAKVKIENKATLAKAIKELKPQSVERIPMFSDSQVLQEMVRQGVISREISMEILEIPEE